MTDYPLTRIEIECALIRLDAKIAEHRRAMDRTVAKLVRELSLGGEIDDAAAQRVWDLGGEIRVLRYLRSLIAGAGDGT